MQTSLCGYVFKLMLTAGDKSLKRTDYDKLKSAESHTLRNQTTVAYFMPNFKGWYRSKIIELFDKPTEENKCDGDCD